MSKKKDDPSERMLDEKILGAVRGEKTGWPIDPQYPAEGSFEDRFNLGHDKQILLWAIALCEPIPAWAVNALRDKLLRAAKGEYKTWDDVFGKIFAKNRQSRGIATEARQYEVWFKVREMRGHGRNSGIGEALFERVGSELGIGTHTTVSKLYYAADRAIKAAKNQA